MPAAKLLSASSVGVGIESRCCGLTLIHTESASAVSNGTACPIAVCASPVCHRTLCGYSRMFGLVAYAWPCMMPSYSLCSAGEKVLGSASPNDSPPFCDLALSRQHRIGVLTLETQLSLIAAPQTSSEPQFASILSSFGVRERRGADERSYCSMDSAETVRELSERCCC